MENYVTRLALKYTNVPYYFMKYGKKTLQHGINTDNIKLYVIRYTVVKCF